MTTNHTAPSGVALRPGTVAADMAAFHALPTEVREALNDAPYQMSAEYVLERVQKAGARDFLAEYAQDCARLNGGRPWQPVRRRDAGRQTSR